MPITSTIARLRNVRDSQREAMFLLHSRYFCNVRRETFYADMDAKDWIILLRDGEDIVGFSTLQLLRLAIDDAEGVFLFSGDTVVDQSHWHDSTLAGAFGHFMLRLTEDWPDRALYWFLISKGYRTYRFLPVYFKSFYPAYDRPTPPNYARLLQTVATHKFGSAYDARAGLIRLGGEKDRLTPEMSKIPEARLDDPHVRFFLERNPTYGTGDELACIADISRENLNKYAWRVINDTTVNWDE